MIQLLTWDFEVEVAGAAHSGDRGSLALPGDALLHPAFAKHLHREWTSCSQKHHTQEFIVCSLRTLTAFQKVLTPYLPLHFESQPAPVCSVIFHLPNWCTTFKPVSTKWQVLTLW